MKHGSPSVRNQCSRTVQLFIDDKRNSLSSMVVGQNVKEITIGSDCVSFRVEMW